MQPAVHSFVGRRQAHAIAVFLLLQRVLHQAEQCLQEDVSAALEALDRRRVLGVVLNGVEDASEHYGYPS